PDTYTLSLHDALPISPREPLVTRSCCSLQLRRTAEMGGTPPWMALCARSFSFPDRHRLFARRPSNGSCWRVRNGSPFTHPSEIQDRKSTRLNSSHRTI